MSWINLITGLLKLVGLVADYLREKQLLEAGQAMAVKDGIEQTLKNIKAARSAVAGLDSDPDFAGRVRDRFDRDE